VQRALKDAPSNSKAAIEQARKYLLQAHLKNRASTKLLRDEWHFLHEAILTVYERRPPKDAIPFRVFGEYQRRIDKQGAVDQILCENMRLGSTTQ
jgi:hypothetical protein